MKDQYDKQLLYSSCGTGSPEMMRDSPSGSPGLEEVRDEILKSLRADGYAYVKWPMSLERFEAVSASLGAIQSRSDIKIDRERELMLQGTRKIKNRASPYRAEALAFHSDNPGVSILSWHCVWQDEADGAILLLDLHDIKDYFPQAVIDAMGRTEIYYSDRRRDSDDEKILRKPLVYKDRKAYCVYYQPWLLIESYDAEQSAALRNFHEYLEYKQKTHLITIPIREGQSLFIDNHRVLHGRNQIAENSRRHLVRFFINNPDLHT